jgi:hypothetical protein
VKYVTVCRNLNEICDCLQKIECIKLILVDFRNINDSLDYMLMF